MKRIPYRIVGSVRFYERQEVKDVLAYLTIIHNPRDIVAFQRAAASPHRGIGKKTIQLVIEQAKGTDGDLFLASIQLRKESSKRGIKALGSFIDLLNELSELVENSTLVEIAQTVLDRSGVYKFYLSIDQVEQSNKSLNLVELVNATDSYGIGDVASVDELVCPWFGANLYGEFKEYRDRFKPPVGGGGDQAPENKDPCKGPNPPAYCFTGGKNQTDEEKC